MCGFVLSVCSLMSVHCASNVDMGWRLDKMWLLLFLQGSNYDRIWSGYDGSFSTLFRVRGMTQECECDKRMGFQQRCPILLLEGRVTFQLLLNTPKPAKKGLQDHWKMA